MSNMNLDLAAMYGTPGGATEEHEKTAQAELFAKLAAQEGIDLGKLSDEQVAELYASTFPEVEKTAAAAAPAAPAAADTEAEKVAAAADAEFARTQDFKEKVAEADYLGRVMAHSYVQELGRIKTASEKVAKSDEKDDDKKDDKGDDKKPEGKGGFPFAAFKKGGDDKKDDKGKDKEAAAAAPAAKTKIASTTPALDTLAVQAAFEKAAEAGFDQDEAKARLNAVFTLGLGESEKIASTTSRADAVELRALEILEAAGYPVTWGA